MAPSGAYIGKAFSAIGIKEIAGMSGGNILGWTSVVSTIDPITQTRSSSETSFPREAITENFNLQIYTSALAKQVLFDDMKRATGVKVEIAGLGSGSVTFQLNATKEVIVSAGAFRLPQLLMVSGIEPAEVLNANNVSVIADHPGVGQGPWDHVYVAVTHDMDVLTSAALADPEAAANADAQYTANRTGIDTNAGGSPIAFEKLPRGSISDSTRRNLDSTFRPDWPDIEYSHLDAYSGNNEDYLLELLMHATIHRWQQPSLRHSHAEA